MITATLAGAFGVSQPRDGVLALVLPLRFHGDGTVLDLRLLLEGERRPLAWVSTFADPHGVLQSQPAPFVVTGILGARPYVFSGPGPARDAYRVTVEARLPRRPGWAGLGAFTLATAQPLWTSRITRQPPTPRRRAAHRRGRTLLGALSAGFDDLFDERD